MWQLLKPVNGQERQMWRQLAYAFAALGLIWLVLWVTS